MGMAASQARFLQLTARRSNNEYMGQQINQARTALANKSAGLFEQMLSLKPPTPPSSLGDQYYTQGYTFIDTEDDIRKKISWTKMETTNESYFDLRNSSATVPNWYTNDNGTVGPATTLDVSLSGDEVLASAGMDDASVLAALQDGTLSSIFNFPTVDENGDPYTFEVPEDATDAVVRYVTIEHTAYDPAGDYQILKEEVPALLFFDNRERLLGFSELAFADPTVSFDSVATGYDPGANWDGVTAGSGTASTNGSTPPTLDDVVINPVSHSMELPRVEMGDELAYSGQFDEEAFNDDMNRYEFDKTAYDYQIERINLETARIQQQDKSLELKLKQIDTDHKAIQTEMEAVQKVIQKNIETTFKTFA